jgi:hypothetical protein
VRHRNCLAPELNGLDVQREILLHHTTLALTPGLGLTRG